MKEDPRLSKCVEEVLGCTGYFIWKPTFVCWLTVVQGAKVSSTLAYGS